MYVTLKKTSSGIVSQDKSLREMLNELLIESDVAVTAVAEEIGINKDSFSEYLKGNYELKLNQAIKVMKLLDITKMSLSGMTGIYEVDMFINSVNPGRLARRGKASVSKGSYRSRTLDTIRR